MKIYYSPAFTANAYFNLKDTHDIAFDTIVCGNHELLTTLMLRLGIHNQNLSESDRRNAYYLAFKKCDAAHPDNLFHDSLQLGEMSVSNECLKWRDRLVLAHWNPTLVQPSDRLTFMAEVEQQFRAPGDSDYFQLLLDKLTSLSSLDFDIQIILTYIPLDWLPPYIAQMLNILGQKGATITETDFADDTSDTNLAKIKRYLRGNDSLAIDGADDTFSIVNFKDETAALQYVASLSPDSYDVYINSSNKNFDDILSVARQPMTGSSISGESPQLLQAFKIGLSLFSYPLNIYNVLSWLLMPKSPVSSGYKYSDKPRLSLRRYLANAIIKSNGMLNEEWKEAINKFMAGAVDDDERASMKKCVDALDILIPHPESSDVNKKELTIFVNQVKKWAKAITLKTSDDDIQKDHPVRLLSLYTSFGTLLENESSPALPYARIEKWMTAIYEPESYTYTQAQRSSRSVIASPSDIATAADNVLWMDFYNHTSGGFAYDFLNSKEKTSLAGQGCLFSDEQKEAALDNDLYLIPILACGKRFTAITVDRRDAAKTSSHPLYIRLKEALDKDHLNCFRHLCRKGDISHLLSGEKVFDNLVIAPEIQIHNAGDIIFRSKESPSSIEELMQYPYDYTMKYLAQVREHKAAELDDISLIKGTVAHYVIQLLCDTDNHAIDAIQSLFHSQFDHLFELAVTEKGAILNLRENLIEKYNFQKKLRQTVGNLLAIISNNHLTVEGCEVPSSADIALYPDTIAGGRMDMVLRNNSGGTIIFDFKWSDTNSDFYMKKLKDNHALQLEIYKALLQHEDAKRVVVAKGYYIMPKSTFYTLDADQFVSDPHIVNVQSDPIPVDMLTLIRNGYKFRIQQLQKGNIEMGEGSDVIDLEYGKAQSESHLYPLYDWNRKGVKDENIFSSYTVFKGSLK